MFRGDDAGWRHDRRQAGLIVTELIDRGIVKTVISTGALMAHGLVEAAGRSHFKYDPKMDDLELYEAGYNRVYDTLEPETNLDFVETIVARILKAWDHNEVLCSYKLNREIGRYLSEHVPERGILKSAFEKNVPVFVPAFSDSEIGLDVALHNRARRKAGVPPLHFDPFEDLEFYADTLLQQERLGIFTIGGGVPRNWAQQFGPFIELRHRRGGEDLPLKRFHYGVRICPEPVNWGGLSGCTYSEAVSWGKFVPPEEGGNLRRSCWTRRWACRLSRARCWKELKAGNRGWGPGLEKALTPVGDPTRIPRVNRTESFVTSPLSRALLCTASGSGSGPARSKLRSRRRSPRGKLGRTGITAYHRQTRYITWNYKPLNPNL